MCARKLAVKPSCEFRCGFWSTVYCSVHRVSFVVVSGPPCAVTCIVCSFAVVVYTRIYIFVDSTILMFSISSDTVVSCWPAFCHAWNIRILIDWLAQRVLFRASCTVSLLFLVHRDTIWVVIVASKSGYSNGFPEILKIAKYVFSAIYTLLAHPSCTDV